MTFLSPIHIVGAGIAGLTLARCLKNRGIQAVIFEKNPSPAKHNYGITLQPRTCQALLKTLKTDAHSFCRRVAVDSLIDGKDLVGSKENSGSDIGILQAPPRAHCGRLEGVLRENLKIEWGHVLDNVSMDGPKLLLEFKNKENVYSKFIIDTSGVHSQVKRAFVPKPNLSVLPYVCFRGTRNIDGQAFRDLYQSNFKGGNVIETKRDHRLLQIWINDYHKDPETVDVSYVYSRPTRESDPLHRPGRAPESSDISEAFFDEVSQLSALDQPFKDAFDGEKIKEDRILHWLMRTSFSPLDELIDFLKMGVVSLGDSAHAMPILGGEGANFAIEDAVLLAEYILVIAQMEDVYRERYVEWENGLKDSEERLREMHSAEKSVL
ncbi:FAD/NAD(P)-binding domain-containing protein [Acephala macrosclerotiorum]|nr:FAD/NAD(P)-binding domain-containing protein [Acephala macrosclerotiorum]